MTTATTFRDGDIVTITGPLQTHGARTNPLDDEPNVYFTPEDDGDRFEVTKAEPDWDGDIVIRSLESGTEQFISPLSVTKEIPFRVGDKVRITGELLTHDGFDVYDYKEGDLVEVADIDSTHTTYGHGSVKIVNGGGTYGQWIDPASLTKVEDFIDAEVIDVQDEPSIGDTIRLTGYAPDVDGQIGKLVVVPGDDSFYFKAVIPEPYDGIGSETRPILLTRDEFEVIDVAEEEPAKPVLKTYETWADVPDGAIVKSVDYDHYLLKVDGLVIFNAGMNPVTSGYVTINDPGFYAPYRALERVSL